jgi:hypothetical protein
MRKAIRVIFCAIEATIAHLDPLVPYEEVVTAVIWRVEVINIHDRVDATPEPRYLGLSHGVLL